MESEDGRIHLYGKKRYLYYRPTKTVKKIEEAYTFVKELAAENKNHLICRNEKASAESIEQEAKRCSMFYVNQRWLGGMLTNFKTIQARINRLHELTKMEEEGLLMFCLKRSH